MKLEIINPIVSTLLPSLQDNWLAGFTDAVRPEAGGCFTLSLLSNSKGYRLRFIISQKWEVNKVILQHVSTIFSVGSVRTHSVADNWEYVVNGVKTHPTLFLILIHIYCILRKNKVIIYGKN